MVFRQLSPSAGAGVLADEVLMRGLADLFK